MRRVVLLALAGRLVSAPPLRAADSGPALTILEPYGEGSVTDRVIGVLQPGLEGAGRTVTVDHAGPGALNRVAAAAPDGNTVVVLGLLPAELAEIRSNPGVKVSSLTPIAKLTGPGSVALVVPDSSPIKSWADFAAAARAKSLKIASPGRDTAAGIPIAMMERALGAHFTDVIAQERSEVLAALKAGKADAAFLVTLTIVATPRLLAPPVRPIVVFGAQRNPGLKEIPTFRESIGPQPPERRHNSITSAVGLFGPPGMTSETAARVAAEFAAAAAKAKESGAIASSHMPIEIADAALLRETMARDHRVIKELANLH